MSTRTALLVALASTLAAGVRAEAATPASDRDEEPRVAIQRPKYQLAHELSLGAGIMPLDPFQKSVTASFSYTVHFSRWLAWEVFQATGALLTSTDLRDELIDTFAISEDDFNAPRFMATTGVELAPIYGKQVFLNDAVVHHAAFVGLHGGVIFGDRGRISETLEDLRPAVGVGIGYRLFVSDAWSMRIDVRDYLSFKRAIRDREQTEIENVLFMTYSWSLSFGRDDG
ncbi:outer membrane beta-barrel domain-containing protein [Myxococcota bacterium]|nr:outer membrane beta-barrel domain-containing protein [Myxococcota bacterium]